MQIVASSVHVCDIVVQVLDLGVELVSPIVFLLERPLQVRCLLFVVFMQLLLVVVKLLDLVVQDLDLVHLRCQDLLVVLLQLEVIQFSIAHVAYAVDLRISSR